MGRPRRVTTGNLVYHVLNRANGKASMFLSDADYEAFERILVEAATKFDMRLLSYCLMPNHWHLVVWPRADGVLSACMQWLTLTHTQRWHAAHGTSGSGHLYQGRFKSFPTQHDEHYLILCRYVEGNALRARLAGRAEDWRWGSLWHRLRDDEIARTLLSAWPVEIPRHWLRLVNESIPSELQRHISQSMIRGRPFGTAAWQSKVALQLGLESTLKPRGRPKKVSDTFFGPKLRKKVSDTFSGVHGR